MKSAYKCATYPIEAGDGIAVMIPMKRKFPVLAIALVIASCSSSDEGSVVNGAVALEDVGQDLFVSLAGFQADKLSLSVRA